MKVGVQLAFSTPQKRLRVDRMTDRQRGLLAMLRFSGTSVAIDSLPTGYRHPRAACDRLVARGLATKQAHGVYRARRVGERARYL